MSVTGDARGPAPRGSRPACPARSRGRRRRASRRCRGRSGAMGRMGSGVVMVGHVLMMPDRRRERWRRLEVSRPTTRATRGRPARSTSTAHAPARQRRRPRARRSPRPGRPRSRAARRRPCDQRLGQPVDQPLDDREPVGAAVERERRLERRRARQLGHRVAPDVRQVGQDEVERRRRARRQQVRLDERGPGPRRHARPRSRGPARAHRARCRSPGSRPPRARAAPQRAPPARPRSRHSPSRRPRSGAAAPRRPRAAPQPPHDLGLGELDEPLGLGPRDQRPRVDLERQAVELLEAAQVGDRLAGRPSLEVRPVAARGIGPDRRLGMGEHDRPPDTDRMPEQQLGVQPRRLRTRTPRSRSAPSRSSAPVVSAGTPPSRPGPSAGVVSRRRAGRPGRP